MTPPASVITFIAVHWVVGDIHGMHRAVARLVDAVRQADPAATLIFAGDYVNRGPDTRQVIDLLLTLPNAIFLRGNHDDVFDLVVNDHSYAPRPIGDDRGWAFQWFMNYGLDSTFHSYGADWTWLRETAGDPTDQRLTQLTNLIPPAHRAFIRNLPAVFEAESFFVVHGYWPVAEPCFPPTISGVLNQHFAARHPLLWERYSWEQIHCEKPWTRRGFVGHTPVYTYFGSPTESDAVPLIGPQLVLIDTGAALVPWGRLTAFCVEENRYLQTTPAGEMVRR